MKGQGPTEYRRACKSTENASFERAFFPGERAFFPGEKAFIILSVFPFFGTFGTRCTLGGSNESTLEFLRSSRVECPRVWLLMDKREPSLVAVKR